MTIDEYRGHLNGALDASCDMLTG